MQLGASQTETVSSFKISDRIDFSNTIIEEYIGGILIVSDRNQLIYINERAKKICRKLNTNRKNLNKIPSEILHLSQFMIDSSCQFPDRNWMLDSQIVTQDSVAIRILVRYVKLEIQESPCLVVTMEDLYKPMEKIAIAEGEKYGLTQREQEVWLLQKAHYTYKQIASELHITPNTVKKHMKSIYCKRKAVLFTETVASKEEL